MPPRGGDEVGKVASLHVALSVYVNCSSPECSFEVVIVPSARLLQSISKFYSASCLGYDKCKLQKGNWKKRKKAKVRNQLCNMEIPRDFEGVNRRAAKQIGYKNQECCAYTIIH